MQPRNRIDPIGVEVPLPPDRDLNSRYCPELSGLDMRDLTDLVFKRLGEAREALANAATRRQRSACEERVRHWWRLYQKMLP